VIAGTLAKAGLSVVVLEAGNYLNEADFTMLEVPALRSAYWRGGPQNTADHNFSLLAGAALGGGSLINWMNCLRTTDRVRTEWADAGLADVASDFDRHLDAVSQRMSVGGSCSDLNPFFERLGDAAQRLGWHTQVADRNVDPERYSPETAGSCCRCWHWPTAPPSSSPPRPVPQATPIPCPPTEHQRRDSLTPGATRR
jgi:choline dehydrogenase-like flavoprotein